MDRHVTTALGYTSEIVIGFMAGAAFAMSLVIGVALFVGYAVMQPEISGNDFERILDFVAGPAAVVFAVAGVVLGIVRARRQVAVAAARARAPGFQFPAGKAIGGIALAVAVSVIVGAVAWPWLIITWTKRGLDTATMVGTVGIPVGVGVIVFVAWLVLRARKPMESKASAARAALRRTHPALLALAFGSSALLAAGTLAAVSDWHRIFFVIFGLPLTLAMFFMHLFSCIWFFRPMPPSMHG